MRPLTSHMQCKMPRNVAVLVRAHQRLGDDDETKNFKFSLCRRGSEWSIDLKTVRFFASIEETHIRQTIADSVVRMCSVRSRPFGREAGHIRVVEREKLELVHQIRNQKEKEK